MYVDSPLSSKASGVYEKNRPSLRPDLPAGFSFFMENLTYITDAEESKKLNDRHEPMIIISASGMAEAGRIRHHLKNNIGEEKNLILFIGYCAEGTLGNLITAGKSPVNIFGEPHEVRAKVVSLDTYSGHADRNELKHYVQQLTGGLRGIFCIHGEETQCLAHAETLRALKPAAQVRVPEYQQMVEI
jgi:metallo-beta-lactamase family protein